MYAKWYILGAQRSAISGSVTETAQCIMVIHSILLCTAEYSDIIVE